MMPQEFAVEIELYGEMGIEKMCVEIRHEPVWYHSEGSSQTHFPTIISGIKSQSNLSDYSYSLCPYKTQAIYYKSPITFGIERGRAALGEEQ